MGLCRAWECAEHGEGESRCGPWKWKGEKGKGKGNVEQDWKGITWVGHPEQEWWKDVRWCTYARDVGRSVRAGLIGEKSGVSGGALKNYAGMVKVAMDYGRGELRTDAGGNVL